MTRTPKTIAKNITLDHERGDLVIDDLVVPFHVRRDIDIEVDPTGRMNYVTVSFFADAVHVNMSHEASLAYIRDVANQQRAELGLPAITDREDTHS